MVMPHLVQALVRSVLVSKMWEEDAMLTEMLVIKYCLVQLGYGPPDRLDHACFLLLSTGRHRVSKKAKDLVLEVNAASGIKNNQALRVVSAGYLDTGIENEAIIIFRGDPDIICQADVMMVGDGRDTQPPFLAGGDELGRPGTPRMFLRLAATRKRGCALPPAISW
nr:hypothetical protein [Hansschlegelia beijingensis]